MDRVQPSKAFIVSHTHWDREWYLTQHQFRVNLIRVFERVMDALETDDAFNHFLMDGQSIILEDYIEVRAGSRDRVARLVGGGELAVGPWYVLPDEFLVSGESMIRNLLIGHRVAGALGSVQKVGYLPDSFGHIAQLPQILRLAGIGSFVFSRGVGDGLEDPSHEFVWEGPDGSEVLAVNECESYCNAGALGLDEIWHAHTRREVDLTRAVEQVRELFAKMSNFSKGDIYLLSNGCDHFPPQPQLGAVLDALRRAFPQTEFVRGELLGSRLTHLFPGVWSTRMYLKQKNDYCQRILADCLEPTAAYAHFMLGKEYPSGPIEYCWKLLLENHPHDSICGCSADEVHEDMGPRFAGVRQTAEQLLRRTLEELVPTFARRAEADRNTAICVMNPLPETRTEIVDRLIVLQPFGIDVDSLRLLDEDGRPVDFDLVDTSYVERFWGIDYRTELFYERQRDLFQTYRSHFGERIIKDDRDTNDAFLVIQFVAEDLPPLGHAVYYLTDREASADIDYPPTPMRAAGTMMENDFYRVRLHSNGVFDIEDKRSARKLTGLNRLEDTEDIGDTYDYSPAPRSETLSSHMVRGTVTLVEDTYYATTLEASYHLPLPRRADRDGGGRVRERVPCEVTTRVRLTRNNPVVAVETHFDNRADDHRLRAVFPTGVKTDTIVSDGHFMVNHRPIARPEGADWVQPPAKTYPQQEFSLVQNEDRGLALLNKGLPEIEASIDRHGFVELKLTLLRAVGWLSRDDFEARNYTNAGPTLHTPGAQCPGTHRFEYAVVPFSGDYISAGIKSISRRYRVPVLCVQGVEDLHEWGGQGLLTKRTGQTSVSAVKKHETRDTLVVRLYNLIRDDVDETLEFGTPVRAAWVLDLLEERVSQIPVPAPRELPFTLGPHEIVTLEVELEVSDTTT
ncbi:MAG: glycoside hydrolase family 38 C-terminal domain-containing protein [bacterium]